MTSKFTRGVLRTACLAVLFAVFPVTATVHAQKRTLRTTDRPADPVLIDDFVASHPLSAFTDATTLFAAEFNLDSIDWNQFAALLDGLGINGKQTTRSLRDSVSTLRGAGAKRMYVLADLQSIGAGSPLVLLPTEDGNRMLKAAQTLFGPMARLPEGSTVVAIGKSQVLDRFDDFQPVLRPDLIAPLRDGTRLDHTAVMVIPNATRMTLRQFLPADLPDNTPLRVRPQELVDAVGRMVISLKTSADPLVRLSIECPSEEAARQIRSIVDQLKQTYASVFQTMKVVDENNHFTFELDATGLKQLQLPFSHLAVESRNRRTSNNLKMLGLGIHNYYAREKHLPPRCFVNPDREPLFSWRVALLPDIDDVALYRSIQLDRAWDKQDNQHFLSTVPKVFADEQLETAHTTLRAPVFPGSIWEGDGAPRKFLDVVDGTSNTIALIDAPQDAAVHWSEPTPWVISEENLIEDVFGNRDSVYVLLLDGAVLRLARSDTTAEKLKAMLTFAGKD